MENNEVFKRCIALIGEDNFNIIHNAKVMVIGLGAVGGYALESIVRTGVNNIVVVDFDVFEASNLNRQILATINSLGLKKCDEAKKRILEINPSANVKVYDLKIKEDILSFIKEENPNFVIDAIDDVVAKCDLIEFLVNNNIGFVSAMGAALKFDPTLIKDCTLDKTDNCHLAKKVRGIMKKKGVDLNKVNVVYSKEASKIVKDECGNNVLGSVCFVPMAMGAKLGEIAIKKLINRGKDE